MGLAFFNAGYVEKAVLLFKALSFLQPSYAPAWRGLGACMQSLKQYNEAVAYYYYAILNDSDDLVSKVYMGESLLLAGQKEEGLKVLHQAVLDGTVNPIYKKYLARAHVLISRNDENNPVNFIFGELPPGLTPVKKDLEGFEAQVYDPEEANRIIDKFKEEIKHYKGAKREARLLEFANQLIRDPKLQQWWGHVVFSLIQGDIETGTIAGFSKKQARALYQVASNMLQSGSLEKAFKLSSFITAMYAKEHDFWQLLGLCAHKKSLYKFADTAYTKALQCDSKNGATWVYRGEIRFALGKRK